MKFKLSGALAVIVCVALLFSIFGGLGYGGQDISYQNSSAPTIIQTGQVTIDTAVGEPEMPEEYRIESYSGFLTGLYLVQFSQSTEPWMLDELKELEMTYYQHINPNTYRIEILVANEDLVRALPFVQWLGINQPWYKLSEEVAEANGVITVEIELTDTGSTSRISAIAESYGGTVENVIDNLVKIVRVTIDSDKLQYIASDPSVVWMFKYHPPQTHMDLIKLSAYTGANTPQAGGYTGLNVLGQVKDNGCDLGHQELTNVIYTQGGPVTNSHGTCTTGIVFATGVDPDAEGMLPDAEGCFSDWGVGRTTGIQQLWNGWGASGPGQFESNSWSQGALDGQYTGWSNQDDTAMDDYPKIIMLYAAGNCNDGPEWGKITQDCANKNGLGIGAAWHDDTADMSDDFWEDDPIWGGGSRGFAADSRVKPDLCGPYDYIYTVDWRGANGYRPGDYVTKSGSDMYFGGTSGATPVVAGQVGLAYDMYMDDYFGNNFLGIQPFASTIKALMIADAYQYPIGVNDIDRHVMGWGSADIENTYNLGASGHYIRDCQESISSGGTETYYVEPIGGGTPLKISLAWTDTPADAGTGSGRALINNLDLTVIAPDGTTYYYGNNGLDDALWSISGSGVNFWAYPAVPDPNGHRDGYNNVENVFIQNPTLGMWTIEVSGRPGGVPDGPLPFSLVASGAQLYDPNNIPTVTVTAPDGGESWEAGTDHNIQWTMSDIEDPTTSLAVTIDYSIDGGFSYPFNIITDQTGFTSPAVYSWQVPSNPTTTAKVRVTVEDTEAGTDNDVSNDDFTIYVNEPVVDVTSPDVGDRLMGGGSWEITWTVSGGSYPLIANPISIEWSTDLIVWIPIPTDGANDGTETWDPVPVMEGNAYVRVQAEDTESNIGEDINGPFWIDLTPPAPAENPTAEFTGANNVEITWDPSPSSDMGHYEVWYRANTGWDPNGDGYLFRADVGLSTNYVHVNTGVNTGADYWWQIRTFDQAGHETRTQQQAAKVGSVQNAISANWHLCGSGLVRDYSLANVLQGFGMPANYACVRTYDGLTDTWKTSINGHPHSPLTQITDVEGFWMYVTATTRFAAAGYIEDKAITLYDGWNLVAFPFATGSMTSGDIMTHLAANCPNFDSMLIADTGQPYHLATPSGAETIQNSMGFWVRVTADTTWTVTNY